MMRSSQYKIKPVPLKQYGKGHCGCQNGDGFLDDVWSGVKSVGKGLKSVGLAPSKLLGMAVAPLTAYNPGLGGAAFAGSNYLAQQGYGKRPRKRRKRIKKKK